MKLFKTTTTHNQKRASQAMEKQVWLFRLLNSASLNDLESVEILLHHLASLAAPTHYVALQVDHCQLELEMIW